MDGQLCPYSKIEVMCERSLQCEGCEIFKEFCKKDIEPANKALDYTQQYLEKPTDRSKW